MAINSVDLSIIIVSYNTKNTTLNCLNSIFKSLEKSKIRYEIIVVDNASSDGSLEILHKCHAELVSASVLNQIPKQVRDDKNNLITIENKQNVGFAKANNQAVKIAEGTHILLLNSDTVVLDDAINKMYNFFIQNNYIHFLGAKLFNKDMTPQASSAPFYTLPVIFGALFLKGDYWGLTRSSPNKTVKTDWVSGACILTKKEYYEKIGGFDEGIFMYMDEVDLLYRAAKQGLHTYFYPQSHFIHLGSASSQGKTYPILQVYKGFLYFYQKHYGHLELFCLKIMLQLKAVISIIIGYITHNSYLIKTYEEALKLAR